MFVFLCGIKDQGAASAIARRQKLSFRSEPRRNGNFCSLLPQQFFLPVALNTNCLIARVHAPSQRVAAVAVGNLGNQSMKWEPAKPRSTLNYNASRVEGKKRERQRGKKKQPPGMHSTSHTIIKSNGVRASASELLLVQFLPESCAHPHPTYAAAKKAVFQCTHFPKNHHTQMHMHM